MKRNNNQKSKLIFKKINSKILISILLDLENNLLIHLIPIVIFSIRELINRISYSNFNIEIIDSQNQIFSFTNITDLLQSSQPLFYLQEYQRFKLFLIILNRLISSSSTTTQQTNYR
ncbi:unnamed protein product [Rotaria sordida]|uniref:Transmembrane protein n=1 Tax=Rotaria sordida TaxID=392033 RepID=A0A819QB05_9BILA|nr:unnamed protein product [Rotaria sordida]